MIRVIILALFIFVSTVLGNSLKILTNHLGYYPDSEITIVIQGTKNDNPEKITIFNVNDSIVQEGAVNKIGTVAEWKNWVYWTFTISGLKEPGIYYAVCENNGEKIKSYPFEIKNCLWEEKTLSHVLCYFKSQRCSGQLNKADKKRPFDGERTDSADVHGGWQDATGDYGKHFSHLSFSTYFNPQQIPLVVWSLFKTYEHLEKRENPNFRQYKKRILDEALYGADYLRRMKTQGGSFYRSVAGVGPEKKPEDRIIAKSRKGFTLTKKDKNGIFKSDLDEQGQKDALYEVSFRSGGGIAIAALAMASQYPVSGDYSSEEYLRAAEDAFAFLKKNNSMLLNNGKKNIVDNYCALIAAVELYKATDKEEYKKDMNNWASELINRISGDKNYQGYFRADDKDRPFFHAADEGFPVIALLDYYPYGDSDSKEKILKAIKQYYDYSLQITYETNNPFGYVRQYVQDTTGNRHSSFFFPHNTETAPWWQGENARLGSLAAAAKKAIPFFPDQPEFQYQLKKLAENQINWILGFNPFDICMLTGVGRNNPQYLFFESWEYANFPGGICNGITAGLENENDIDFHLTYAETGKDNDWRWTEQWLPHAAWYLYAISLL